MSPTLADAVHAALPADDFAGLVTRDPRAHREADAVDADREARRYEQGEAGRLWYAPRST